VSGPHAVILGLVQGITEFLPISSSAHLILTAYFLGWEDQGLYFDIAVHLGSMLAVVVYLRKELGSLAQGLRSRSGADTVDLRQRKLAQALLVGTVPVGLAGLLLSDFVASAGREPVLIAITTIVFGIALLVADRKGGHERALRSISWQDGLLIGLGQALALIPGTSRAGITMTVALALGYERDAAARFSLLLAIPVSVLVGLKQILDVGGGAASEMEPAVFLLGFAVSAAAAYAAIDFLIRWVKRQDYSLFVAYRVILGLVILVSVWR
jgi:undecaprenyl-diphosphatase